MIKVAIVGVSGYTGVELLRLLLGHPNVEILHIAANANAGKEMGEIYSEFSHIKLPKVCKIEEINFMHIDCVFLCLPHTASMQKVDELCNQYSHLKIIDLSADFRLPANIYEKAYKTSHIAESILPDVAYGLPEFFSDDIKKKRIISVPGCYVTSVLLPLMPIKNSISEVIIDSKSGISGAGRKVEQNMLFCERNESVSAYSIGVHRHGFEISHYLDQEVLFVPHLVPVSRGIESTIYFKTDIDVKDVLSQFYAKSSFVHLVDSPPTTRSVLYTNLCKIFITKCGERTIISSVLDNICRGSSGQAVQCMNIAFSEKFGVANNAGLNFIPIFP